MIPDPRDEQPVDVVIHHPRLEQLARTVREHERLQAFARDLARWLVGMPREHLGALARVVTIVAQRELRDARALCKDRPLLAVEAAARATEALWPLLRSPLEPPDPPPEEEDEEGGAGGGGGGGGGEGLGEGGAQGEADPDEESESSAAGAGEGEGDAEEGGEGDAEGEGDGQGEGEGDEEGEGDGDPLDPADVLDALAGMQSVADPELDALAERLQERLGQGDGAQDATDVGAAAAELLEEAGNAAAMGAMQTDKVARHLERFLPGVGWSTAPGALGRTLMNRLDGLVKLLEQLRELKDLADALGRLEEASRKRGPTQGGREEVVGVHLGGEVANALPSELALLADPDTEDLFYQRYTERRLISLELVGEGDSGSAMGDKRGPVIACIDTSGSMEGAPELAAKALVLAICRKVLPRGRTVHLLLFGGPGERTEIRLRRGRGGLEGLLDFLGLSFHSGTDFDGPLLRAMDLLEEMELKAADVLVVTDGLCRATDEVVERVLAVREKQGARVWSVVLGRRDTWGVEQFSHKVFQFDPEHAAAASGLLREV